ncbi:hypothetical protein G7046_g2501 [Stylonectria norvegica]|nr:hypothetical protein G7046_g2501 [Stylonectria norvegica]
MQQPNSWALLSAIYAFTLAAAGSLPRGVGPEYADFRLLLLVASFYQEKDVFSCVINAAIKLSLSQVNDNSCDCPDGSDEPGTAACAKLDALSPQQPLPGSISGTTNTTNALPGFWCENKGHLGMYVPFSFVNDGVCDYDLCCDGSEEFKGIVKCENRCAEIGKEYRRLDTEKRQNMEKAGKKRKTMAKEAKELHRQVEAKIAGLKGEISDLEIKKAELQQKHREIEQQEKGKVVKSEGGGGGKLGVLVGLAKTRVNELRDTLEKTITQRDLLRDKVDELESILRKFKDEYNPNFNDDGVKSAVKSFDDYAARQETENNQVQIEDADIINVLREDSESNGVNWKEFEESDDDDTDVLYSLEAYMPPFLRSIVHDQIEGVRVWLIQNGMLADNPRAGSESHLAKAAREAVDAVEMQLKTKTRALENDQADLAKDYGPADVFRALKSKCVSRDAGEYTYEFCWLDKTSQKSKKGHGQTIMGNFQRIDREIADDEDRLDGKSLGKGERMVLRYEDGQACWNGPKRRTDVWLGCAETEELWRVSESEKCVYKMEVGTPAACEVEEAVEEPHGKDEL